MEDLQKLYIPDFNGSDPLILFHPKEIEDISEIYEHNRYYRTSLLTDIVCGNDEISFDMWTRNNHPTIVELWNCSSEILTCCCKNHKDLINCLKDLSAIIYNILGAQFFIENSSLVKSIQDLKDGR